MDKSVCHTRVGFRVVPFNRVHINYIRQHKHSIFYLLNSILNVTCFNSIKTNTILQKRVLKILTVTKIRITYADE